MSRKRLFIDTPWMVAHRGARDQAPENTRAAFDRALSSGADGIEFDVQLSKDGVPVLYHDRTLYQISGRRQRVGDLTLDQLRRLDWGQWFAPDFSGEPLLTLDYMFALYAGCTRLLLEIKSRRVDRRTGRSERLVSAVVDALDRVPEPFQDGQLFLLSFDPEVLAAAHRLRPNLDCVLNIDLPRGTRAGRSVLDKAVAAISTPLAAITLDVKRVVPDLGRRIHEQGFGLMTYACNTPRQVEKAMSAEADVIMTDRPGWLYERQQGKRSTEN